MRRSQHAGDFQSAADAGTFDQRHGRMRAVGNGIECLGHFSVVVQRLFQRGAAGDKFFQVTARGKGLVASAAQHDAADARGRR